MKRMLLAAVLALAGLAAPAQAQPGSDLKKLESELAALKARVKEVEGRLLKARAEGKKGGKHHHPGKGWAKGWGKKGEKGKHHRPEFAPPKGGKHHHGRGWGKGPFGKKGPRGERRRPEFAPKGPRGERKGPFPKGPKGGKKGPPRKGPPKEAGPADLTERLDRLQRELEALRRDLRKK